MEQVHLFHRGMNKDMHPNTLTEGQYIEANNAVLMNPLQGNLFCLSNEPGFTQVVTNSEALRDTFVIGMCNIREDIVLFLIRIDSKELALKSKSIAGDQILNLPLLGTGTSSEVGVLYKNIDDSYTYKPCVNDKQEKYWSSENALPNLPSRIKLEELLNFDIKHQISCTARFDHANRPVVYFTDGKNEPRRLVLDIDYTDDINKHTFKEIATQLKLIEAPNLVYIMYKKTLSNGLLYPGVYQFAARYLNENLDPTTFGYICHPIPVVDDFRSEGRYEYDGASFEAPLVSKSIEFTAHNIDQNYAYIEFVCIFYRTAASTPVIKTIGRYNITGTTMSVIFDGTVYEDISLLELLREPVVYKTAEHILQKDGRLFLSNLTSNDSLDLQDLANNIRIRYTIREIFYEESDAYFNDYKEEGNTFAYKGYRRGEVYSFGIVGVFKDGSKSFVHTIPGVSLDAEAEDIRFDLDLQQEKLYAPVIYNNDPITPDVTFKSFGYLNPYISNEYYPNAPLVTKSPPYFYVMDPDGNKVDLTGKHVRHHRMPSVHQEPFIKKDINGNTWLRILGIQLEGISEYLKKNEALNKKLVQIIVVRQPRKRDLDKSILSQGCLNPLNYQEGRKKEEPTNFTVDYKLGIGNIPIGIVDHLADAIFTLANPLYTIGLRNLDFNGRLEPFNIDPSYSIDPFWGNTFIQRENQAIFYNGSFTYIGLDRTYDHFAFLSPESNFVKSFRIPTGAYIRPVMRVSGGVVRIVNTRINAFLHFLDGAYYGEPTEPYNSLYRAPYYHLFADFSKSFTTLNKYEEPLEDFIYKILAYKRAKWNDIVTNNGNLQDLSVKVHKNALGKDIKLNCYETEGVSLLQLWLDDPYIDVDDRFYDYRRGINSININIGARFNILFAPYLPLWLLKLVKDTSDYGTPDDAVAFLGVGGNKIIKAILFIGNILIGIAVAILELIFIRGAVVNLREVQDDYNLVRRSTNRLAGYNRLSCGYFGTPVLEEIPAQTLNEQNLSKQRKQLNELKSKESEATSTISKADREIEGYDQKTATLESEIEGLEAELKDLYAEYYGGDLTSQEKDQIENKIGIKKSQLKDKKKELDKHEDQDKDYWNSIKVNATEDREELRLQIKAVEDSIKTTKELVRLEQIKNPKEEFCEQERNIYSVEVLNEKQYGPIGVNEYVVVDVLFSEKAINDNNDIVVVDGNIPEIGIPHAERLKYDSSSNTTTFIIRDTDLEAYNIQKVTRALFNGDTFITKYFFKVSHNSTYGVPNIGQNNANRYSLEKIYRGGGSLIIGPIMIPIPNFLAYPGSAGAAMFTNMDGRLFSFVDSNGVGDSEMTSGLESVQIINERVADPLFPSRDGMSMRGGNWVWLESDINTEYRHRPVSYINSAAKSGGNDQYVNTGNPDNAKLGVPYYPKDSLAWSFEVTPEYGQSNGYNQQYSIQNYIKPYFTRPFGQQVISEHRYRIIASEPIDSPVFLGKIQKSEFSDKYRIFLPFSYQEIPKNKGVITDMFELNGEMFAHTEQSLWKLFVNTKAAIPTTAGQVFLGNAGMFQNPPVEIQTLTGGYAGTLHKWANITTPFGRIFVDYLNKKVFNFTGQLEEISSMGMIRFFSESLTSVERENNIVNPIGVGLGAFYDPFLKRYVLTIKYIPHEIVILEDIDFFIHTHRKVEIDSSTNRAYYLSYKTLSFNLTEKSWTSFHDYCPAVAITVNSKIYSTANYIDNNIYSHNNVVGRENRKHYSLYGMYYEQHNTPFNPVEQPEPLELRNFSIIFAINEGGATTKVYDNLTVNAEFFNESTEEGIKHHGDFFNTMEVWTDSLTSGVVSINIPFYSKKSNGLPYTELEGNCSIYNNEFRISLPTSNLKNKGDSLLNYDINRFNAEDIFLPGNIKHGLENRPRLKGKYCIVKLTYTNSYKDLNKDIMPKSRRHTNLSLSLYSILSKFRLNVR